uniref:F-box domain-containing protein n=1 Tax=Caenorhabditis tropicalis TaxID=1561998 RepID=A0A1I7T7P8_9PELO
MADRFPLLKLPYLCVIEVLSNLHMAELVTFSMITKKLHPIIKSLRKPIRLIDVEVMKKATVIRFAANEVTELGRWFIRDSCWYPTVFLKENLNNGWSVDGIQLDCRYLMEVGGRVIVSYTPYGYHELACEKAIKHVMDLFRVSIDNVIVHPKQLVKSKFPHEIGMKTCKVLQVVGSKRTKSSFREFLRRMEVKDAYLFEIPIHTNISKKLKTKKVICTRFQKWLTRDVLFSFEYDELYQTKHLKSISADDVNQFIYRWFESNNKTFRMVLLKLKNGVQEHRFEDLNAMDWSPEKRSSCYPYSEQHLNLSEGRDIERRDGLLATVFYHDTMFFFCVWHERFPAIDGTIISFD